MFTITSRVDYEYYVTLSIFLIFLLIGAVPDRGGRANEMRPKALSSGGNSGRGRGGRGGGSGGGGGGRGNHHHGGGSGAGGGGGGRNNSNKRQQGDQGKQSGRESKVSKTTPVTVPAAANVESSTHNP